MFSGLFKSAFEKIFNVSQLKIEKDPFYAEPSSTAIKFKFNGTYQDKPINLFLFENNEMNKKILLSKHNALPNLLQFKQAEVQLQTTEYKLNDTYLCVLVPQLTPVIFTKLEYIDCLQLMQQISQALQFINEQLEIYVSKLTEECVSFCPQQQQYVFTGYQQLTYEKNKPSQQIVDLIRLINNKQENQFPEVKMSPSKYLQSETFNNPIFQVLSDLDDQNKIGDQLYLRSLHQILRQISVEMLFNNVVSKILTIIQQQQQFTKNVFHILIDSANYALDKQKVYLIQKQFNQMFQHICNLVKSDPKEYIEQFVQLKNLNYLSDSSAQHFVNLSVVFLQKQLSNQNTQQLTTIIGFFIQQFQENTVLFCRNANLQQLLQCFSLQIKQFSSNRQQLISWNCFLTISNLLKFNDELVQKINGSKKLDDLPKDTFVGMGREAFWKGDLFESVILSIGNGNYDFIQAVYLLNICFPSDCSTFAQYKIQTQTIGAIICSLHSAQSLHLGILSLQQKQRDLTNELYQKCISIGLQIQEQNQQQRIGDKQEKRVEKKENIKQEQIAAEKQEKKVDQCVKQQIAKEKTWQSEESSENDYKAPTKQSKAIKPTPAAVKVAQEPSKKSDIVENKISHNQCNEEKNKAKPTKQQNADSQSDESDWGQKKKQNKVTQQKSDSEEEPEVDEQKTTKQQQSTMKQEDSEDEWGTKPTTKQKIQTQKQPDEDDDDEFGITKPAKQVGKRRVVVVKK